MLRNSSRSLATALLCVAAALYAADKPKTQTSAAVDPYAEVQPATETIDLTMYQRIRDEGLNRSHVMSSPPRSRMESVRASPVRPT